MQNPTKLRIIGTAGFLLCLAGVFIVGKSLGFFLTVAGLVFWIASLVIEKSKAKSEQYHLNSKN